ncbi:aurora kinase A- and ninein-interacting protein [Anomaloglossus baeobatrachus]|uniref:aurora kinase A- and ninein-interacting protein n=1 Tax=Anomaloglossus baeobatrachus TaxID=238106 RepID=UPI003F50D0C4
MKSKKRVRALPQPEECGVWLDASQLKKKSLQTVFPCTSSRFNQLPRKQCTESMLDECAEIKSPQLCTKQTSMYSFFSPADHRNEQPCITDTMTQEIPLECEERNAQEAPNEMKPWPTGASTCLKQTYSDQEPAESLENSSSCKIQRNTENNESSGQKIDTWSSVLHKPGHHASRSQETSLKPSTNYWATSVRPKYQNNASEPLLSTSPQGYKKEEQFLPRQCESQLFTQDTQGNRVICHRFPSDRPRSTFSSTPLQDKTNVTWDARSPRKGPLPACDEEPLNMFTQDSEGNMVIKH